MASLSHRLALAALSTALLSLPVASGAEPAGKTTSSAKAAQAFRPTVTNLTHFPEVLLVCDGTCSAGTGSDYYTLSTKLSFDIDRMGGLTISGRSEPSMTLEDDPSQDRVCSEKGGAGNQRSTWYPDTAIFVRGGYLVSVRNADKKRQKLFRLSETDRGDMKFTGKKARDTESAFVPCVGPHRVNTGFRLDGFLPQDAVMAVRTRQRRLMRISLPDPTEPYLVMHYLSGAVIPVPLRPVVVTIDIAEQRLVVYYQSTFGVDPLLSKIELRSILPYQTPSEGESDAQFSERTHALLTDLRTCAIPTKPVEACATPERQPNPRIFPATLAGQAGRT